MRRAAAGALALVVAATCWLAAGRRAPPPAESPLAATAIATAGPVPAGTGPLVEDPLAAAIRRVPSSAGPGVDESERLARLFRASAVPCPDGMDGCDPDGWTLAAIAWVESGFRSWAVEGDGGKRGAGAGPGLGMMGLHRDYVPKGVDPFVPERAVPAAAARMLRFYAHHAARCEPLLESPDGSLRRRTAPHDPLGHYAGGYSLEGNARAHAYAAEVRDRRRRLIAASGAPR